MRIAIPVENKNISAHFGHCREFALVDVDPASKTATRTTWLTPPAHEPGVLPAWLHDQGTTVIIAQGMGGRAQALFAERGIDVVVGVGEGTADEIVEQYLQGTLKAGANFCDH